MLHNFFIKQMGIIQLRKMKISMRPQPSISGTGTAPPTGPPTPTAVHSTVGR